MNKKPYYFAYEDRYRAVYAAGLEHWGHSPEDRILYETLKKWVDDHRLQGKRIVEFACGEGACGVILSSLGCIYHGVDISDSALQKAAERLQDIPNTELSLLDMVRERVPDAPYDAALDCMGLHMLITDHHREAYLKNAYASLSQGAPMLFFRESYREHAYCGSVSSLEEWERITGEDYHTPQRRSGKDGTICEIPLLPARAKNKQGYLEEMQNAGFTVTAFTEMDINEEIPFSVTIFTKKGTV